MADTSPARVSTADRVALVVVALIYVAGVVVVRRSTAAMSGAASVGTATATTMVATRQAAAGPNTPQEGQLARHAITFELAPKAGYEFKYRLAKGAAMVYAWTSSGPVKFELHGEPDGARPGYADTYQTGESQAGSGVFVAPTSGIHGWYWENIGAGPVWITLKASGFFTAALEIRATGEVEQRLER